MLRRFFFLICFPALLLTATQKEVGCDNFCIAPAPAWVRPSDFPLEVLPSQENVQCLLIDEQRNWPEQTVYNHFVFKALTKSGVEGISQLSISFEPSFQKLILHDIRIFRDGEWSERIYSSQHHLIQKEEGLDQGIFSGDLSLVYILDDIRVGDIVDYAYSKIGENPLFSSHYSDSFFLQHTASIEKLSYRFLSHPDHPFVIQAINTTLTPKINDLSSDLREWSWEVSQTPVYIYETDRPAWYSPLARVHLSQFQTWREVAEKLIPLFDLSAIANEDYPQQMLELINEWKESTNDPMQRALLALRFVQDEVRYLGLEDGVNGFRPHDPREVFKKRFGDCKDKTQLLRALLHLMQIDSSPLLVHSHRGKLLSEEIPTPFAFNHAVIQIEIEGTPFWADATMSLQGGTLQNNYFPNYYTGLLLSKERPELITLPEHQIEKPSEFETYFSVRSAQSVELRMTRTYYGFRADMLRGYLENEGLDEIAKDRLNDLQERYGGGYALAPMEIEDLRDENIISISESYHIPTRQQKEGNTLEIASATVENYLQSRINPERSSPFALSYPLWVKEHIHVDNSLYSWGNESEKQIYEHESIFFRHGLKIKRHQADFHFELKHLQDHIPKNALHEYWNIAKDIESNGVFELPIFHTKS